MNRVIWTTALVALIVGAIAAVVAGEWTGLALALVGVVVVWLLFWSRPAR